jgi:hypothetical protein
MVENNKKEVRDPSEKEVILPPNMNKGKYPDVNNANLPKERNPVNKKRIL